MEQMGDLMGVNVVIEHNMREFFEHGPGLRTTTRTCVVAKSSGKVLIYGLGAMGCGQMVFSDESYRGRDDFREAPEVDDVSLWFFDPFSMTLRRMRAEA